MLGLKFTMEARHGGTVLVDMAALDPRPLAIAFAGALRRSAALGGPIDAASVIKQYVQVYRHFRSEEHTSELQSLMRISYAVFCLKKKMPSTTIDSAYLTQFTQVDRLRQTQ